MAVIWVPAPLTVKVVAAVLPKSTAVAPVKPVPSMTTLVPPVVGPAVGLTLETTGCTVPAMATCTALMLTPSTVTVASRGVPLATLLSPVRLTVSVVLVAAVTVPVTPLLKVTLSLAAVGSKAVPLIVELVEADGQAGGAGGHRLQLEGADVGCGEPHDAALVIGAALGRIADVESGTAGHAAPASASARRCCPAWTPGPR